MKLGEALRQRNVAPHIYESQTDARQHVRDKEAGRMEGGYAGYPEDFSAEEFCCHPSLQAFPRTGFVIFLIFQVFFPFLIR